MIYFATYSLALILGLGIAVAYGQKTKGFRISEYVLLFILPFGYVLWLSPESPDILFIFLASCLVGPVLEWLVGFAYHRTLGEPLWTYKRLNISGYTSWLSIPLWGLVGVFFYFLALIFVGV